MIILNVLQTEEDDEVDGKSCNHGLKDVPFVAVPDLLFKFNENGTVCD